MILDLEMECGCVLGGGRGPGRGLLVDVEEVSKHVKTLLCFPLLLSHIFLQYLLIYHYRLKSNVNILPYKKVLLLEAMQGEQQIASLLPPTPVPYMPVFLCSTY